MDNQKLPFSVGDRVMLVKKVEPEMLHAKDMANTLNQSMGPFLQPDPATGPVGTVTEVQDDFGFLTVKFDRTGSIRGYPAVCFEKLPEEPVDPSELK